MEDPGPVGAAGRLRILFVSNLFPPDIGGPATHISRLAAELHGSGHEVRAVVCAEDARARGGEPYPVRRVSRRLPVPTRFALVFAWSWWWALRSDLVYINGLELPGVLAGLLSGRPRVLKVVGDFAWEYALRHGWTDDGIDDFQRRSYPAKAEAVRLIQRLYCALSSKVVVPSRYLGRLVEGWGVPPAKTRVIANALTGEPKVRLDREEIRRRLAVQGPMVLTVARLYSWKKVDDLIRLSPRFAMDATLVVVGDGPERGRLEALARGTGARCVFAGAVPQEDVYSYLAASDAFVLNTRYEGMSHVILEARWAGAPIVTTSVGGNLEILEHGRNALLVEYGDHEALVAAVNSLLEDRALATRLSAAARHGLEHYRWERQVGETLDLCLQTARRG